MGRSEQRCLAALHRALGPGVPRSQHASLSGPSCSWLLLGPVLSLLVLRRPATHPAWGLGPQPSPSEVSQSEPTLRGLRV